MAQQPTQFDVARKRAEQQSKADLQQQQDAIKRRFASLGAASSGAAMKQQQMAAEKSQEQLQTAQEGIGAQEAAETARKEEIKQGQEFQAGQAEKARQFALGERAASEAFQTAQTQKQMDFQNKIQEWSQSQQAKEFDLAFKQFQQDTESTEFNKRLAAISAAQDIPGITAEGLLGGSGVADVLTQYRNYQTQQAKNPGAGGIQSWRVQNGRSGRGER